MSLEETARGLIDAMQPRGGTEPYDTSATVLRVEGGTLWVHIPGGAEETPVQKTINASPGDTIQIRVGGGTAWAVGNATAPPTDDTVATAAAAQATEAEKVANGVKASLEVQEGQIRAAVETADEASQAASEAIQKLDSITLRVIGSDGTVSEIQINDQGQINLLGTVLAQKIMAEDLVATNSFQVNNGVWNLTQGTTGMELASADGNTSMSVVDGDLTIAMVQSDGTDSMVKVQNDTNNDPVVTIHATRQIGSLRPVVDMAAIIVNPDGINLTGGVTADTLIVADTLTLNGTDLATALSGKAPTKHSSTSDTYGLGTGGAYGHVKTVNNVTTSAHANGLALSAYQGKVLKGLIDDQAARFEYKEAVSLNTIKTSGLYFCYQCTGTPSYQPWSSFSLEVFAVDTFVRQILRPNVANGFCWERRYDGSSWDSWAETGRTIPLSGNFSTATTVRKPGNPTYGSVLITGTVGGIGGVAIAVTISNGAIGSIRNLMTGAAWSNSALTITYGVTNNVGYLTFKTTSTSNSNICVVGG